MTDSEKALEPDYDQHLEQRNGNGTTVVAGPKPVTKREKAKRHFKKWWWVHVLIIIALALLITLPIIYVGFPRIARHDLKKATNEVTELQFLSPSPDTIQVTQRVTTKNPTMYTPSLDAFAAGTYVIENGTYASDAILLLPIPPIHATKPTSDSNVVNATCNITNQDQIALYATQLLTQKTLSSGLAGKTKLHLGKLPVIDVTYNTTSTYNGLNGLKGFNVTDIKIDIGNTLLLVPNMNGTAYIPNPSNITAELGNVTLSLNAASGKIGQTLINDMIIRPGDNYLPLVGIMNQTLVLANTVNGFINLTIVGTDVVYNGKHIPYYETALAANILSLTLNVQQILKDSVGL